MLSEQLEKYSNYTFACPQPPGSYYFGNFPVNAFSIYVPRSLVGKMLQDTVSGKQDKIDLKTLFEFVMTGTAKVSKSKPFVQAFTWKFYGGWLD